ncbi:hypothetical protein ABZ570_24885 [Micromonospora sp. NPDC007271]|uniref:hypothetical protein n=1 Tax=Micromonospora sp. NPDC007271 TaxID=3154587 RepID=UPI0033D74213
MDEETVERLLAGSVPVARSGPELLVRLLAAVRAAPRPHELVGEAAAVRAFRMVRADPVSSVAEAARPERIPGPRCPPEPPSDTPAVPTAGPPGGSGGSDTETRGSTGHR